MPTAAASAAGTPGCMDRIYIYGTHGAWPKGLRASPAVRKAISGKAGRMAPGRPAPKAACRTVSPASAGKAAPAPAAGMSAGMAHASAAGAAASTASACTAHTDHLHVIFPRPDPAGGEFCFKVIFHKLIVKLEFVNFLVIASQCAHWRGNLPDRSTISR